IFHKALDARDAPHSKTAICSTSLYARSPFVGCNNFAEISLTLSRLSTTVWIQSKIKLGIKNACCSPTSSCSRYFQPHTPTLSPLDIPRLIKRSEEHTSELQSRFDLVC